MYIPGLFLTGSRPSKTWHTTHNTKLLRLPSLDEMTKQALCEWQPGYIHIRLATYITEQKAHSMVVQQSENSHLIT